MLRLPAPMVCSAARASLLWSYCGSGARRSLRTAVVSFRGRSRGSPGTARASGLSPRTGSTYGHRVLVTTGLVDVLPDVPGLAERWGRDVLHCVYCHGWEVRDKVIGVLGNFHQALLFRQMSKDVTLFLHTATELTDEQWEQLAALGVDVVDGEATGLEADSQDQLAGVRLASGRWCRSSNWWSPPGSSRARVSCASWA